MKLFFYFLILIFFLTSCSHQNTSSNILITSTSGGTIKKEIAPFPLYLTDKLESRANLEKIYAKNLFIIHTGHVLKPNLSKDDNEKALKDLQEQNFNLINLTLEDFIIADMQGINFENFSHLAFINSSIIDLNLDAVIVAKNITPSFLHDGVVFIGLSDSILNAKLPKENLIIQDYVLSILKTRKDFPRSPSPFFIIIHTLGKEINEVMNRLPPSFINL